MRAKMLIVTASLVASIVAASADEGARTYSDPTGAFSIGMPAGFEATRRPLGEIGELSRIAAPGTRPDGDEPQIEVLVVPAARVPAPADLHETARGLFNLVLSAILEQGEVAAQQTSAARLSGLKAVRCDLTYRMGASSPMRSGYMLAVLGRTNALLVAVSARQGDVAGLAKMDRALAPFAVGRPDSSGGTIAQVSAPKTAFAREHGLDDQLTESDLASAVEMIRFLWIHSGRDAAALTPDALAALRAHIQAGFAAYPADLQYLFANADPIYHHMEEAWAAGGEEDHEAYTRQFAESIDALGLGSPRMETEDGAANGGEEGDAWADVNPDEVKAGLVSNTCWNLAQKATSGS